MCNNFGWANSQGRPEIYLGRSDQNLGIGNGLSGLIARTALQLAISMPKSEGLKIGVGEGVRIQCIYQKSLRTISFVPFGGERIKI